MSDITAKVCIEGENNKVRGWVWTPVTHDDVCVPLRVEDFDDLTLSVHGTLDSATVACRGSNLNNTEATTGLLEDYFPITDANTGEAVALGTDNTASVLLETATYVQPTFGGGSTNNAMDISIVLGGK